MVEGPGQGSELPSNHLPLTPVNKDQPPASHQRHLGAFLSASVGGAILSFFFLGTGRPYRRGQGPGYEGCSEAALRALRKFWAWKSIGPYSRWCIPIH